ncbi:MAG: sugar phosphate nucleotidyltransferase [Treponema sp.]|nr:sugar phosphate nucleotidyltransferase [Treponema sp.]
MFDDCVIMAGGSGTRLWPASSSRLPKQFLPAGSGEEKQSFFQMAVERALAVTAHAANGGSANNGRVIIITGEKHIPRIAADLAKLSAAEKKRIVVIGEPAAKNTAAAIACAAVYASFASRGASGNPSGIADNGRKILVLTSDHIITPRAAFAADAALAASSAAEGKLAIFGIPPERPETGYGYIEAGKESGGVFAVSAFHEKPDLQTAKKYIASKRFFWNSGMFAFTSNFMAQQFHDFAPEVFAPLKKLKSPAKEAYTILRGIRILNRWHGLKAAYTKAKSVSFDVAIAEKCRNTVMVRASFDWLDIGNWEEYIKVCDKNSSLVFRAAADTCYVDSDIPVALAGVEDLIVVIRSGKNGEPPVALVTRRGQTQKVRDIVDEIKKAGKAALL